MTFLAALSSCNQGKIPIWLMRQAGRFLPSYHAFKRGYSLKELFHDPDKIVAITQLPLSVLAIDAAILFSDILTVLDGLGVSYHFEEGTGPVISFRGIMPTHDPYSCIAEAIVRLKQELTVPLIGFAGAPFTVASYLIEGKTTKQFLKAKRYLFEHPQEFQRLIDQVTKETIRYLDIQIRSGVDAIQLFDSWAHHLAPHEFAQFALQPLERIVCHVRASEVPIIIFSKASAVHAMQLANIHPTCLSLDWSADLPLLRQTLPKTVALQGNLDPSVLYGSQEMIKAAIDRIVLPMLGDPGFIFNLGHGILPDTPFEHVKFMVDYVNALSSAPLQIT